MAVVGDFNVDVSVPKREGFTHFMLETLGMRCHTDPAQLTTHWLTGIGLTLSKNVPAVASMPISVLYHSDNKAIVSVVTR